jgi:hypothetical protein
MCRRPNIEAIQTSKLQIGPLCNDIYLSYRNRSFCTMCTSTCTVTVIKPVILIMCQDMGATG